MQKVDLAWVAGLFEGEGSITIARLARKDAPVGYALRIQVGMTDEECIKLLEQILGGYVYPLKPNKKARQRRPIFMWGSGSAQAGRILERLLPYFRSSRVCEKAVLAIEFQAQKRLGARYVEGYAERQHDFFQRMRKLNERGLPMRNRRY